MKNHVGLVVAWAGLGLWGAGEKVLKSEALGGLGAFLACLASIITIWRHLRERRRVRLEEALLKQKICEECRRGYPPDECPFDRRPVDCELKKKGRK